MSDPYKDLETDEALNPPETGETRHRRTMEADDVEYLMEQPQFIRWLLTFKEKSRIDHRSNWTHETSLSFEAGRRDLGLEVLDAIREVEPRVDLFLAVEKTKSPNPGAVNGKRRNPR